MILESSNLKKLLRRFVRTLGNWTRRHGLPLFSLVAVSILSGADGHALELEQATQNSKRYFSKCEKSGASGESESNEVCPESALATNSK